MIYIIGLSCINVLLQVAEPIILIKRWFGFKEELYDTYSNSKRFIHRLLYCALCLGFWVSLIISGDILTAATCSIIGEIIKNKLL